MSAVSPSEEDTISRHRYRPNRSKKERRRNLSKLTRFSFLPSVFTLLSLFLGFSAVIQTVKGQFQNAIYLIIGSAILDGIDGTVARLTKTESSFGVQLDSLVDAVSFGFVPGFLIYRWGFMDTPYAQLGQLIGFIFLSAGVIRLARFNVMKEAEISPSGVFIGLPIPLGALSVSCPILLQTGRPTNTQEIVFFMLYVVLISLLMISNVKYRTLKNVDSKYNLPILLGVAVLLSMLVLFPKATLPGVVVFYITSPFLFWLILPKKPAGNHPSNSDSNHESALPSEPLEEEKR